MKNIFLLLFLGFSFNYAQAQNAVLPLTLLNNNDAAKPLIFYISGDGGMNKFTSALTQNFNANGYAVVALDAREYFWKKKTPQQASLDFGKAINQYLGEWKKKNFILMGYSFGADVAPFIFNNLTADLQNKTESIVLLSPSTNTDFEIHISNLLGFNSSDGQSVVAELNKISKATWLFFGSDEKDFPVKKITAKNKQIVMLTGNHHYDGEVKNLAAQIISRIR